MSGVAAGQGGGGSVTGARAFGGAAPLDALAAIGGGGFGGIGTPQELIGHGLDERGAHDVLDRCVGLGVGIVDTAYGYAGGASHRMIGSWLAATADRRGQIAIVDKVGVVARDGHVGIDLSADRVLVQAGEGRRRLGVAAVDVIMTHGPDPATPPVDTAAALARLLERGWAGDWGVSNVTHDDLVAWLDAADRIGLPDSRTGTACWTVMTMPRCSRCAGNVASPISPTARWQAGC